MTSSTRKCFALLGLLWAGAPAAAQFPEYANQNTANTFMRSGIVTHGGATYWDRRFEQSANAGLANGYKEVAFAFNQCFGGGMIDELVASNINPASYTSAARHDQPSYARSEDLASGIDPNFPQIRRVESTYNLHYGPASGGANPSTQRAAAQTGYNNDIYGPVIRPMNPITRPQYTSTGNIGDNITLRRNNPQVEEQNQQYLAIVFGGSTQLDFGPALLTNPPPRGPRYANGNLAVNWNNLLRIHDALLAAGYAEADMFIMYPGGHQAGTIYAGGPAIPNWVDAGTRPRDLDFAWRNWLANRVTNRTQVYYWSSWGHGNRQLDVRAKRAAQAQGIPRGQAFAFDMEPGFAAQLGQIFDHFNPNGGEGAEGTPEFEVITSIPLPWISITVNGIPLTPLPPIYDPFGDGSEHHYKFSIPRVVADSLRFGGVHTLVVDYPFEFGEEGLDFILQMGPTLGPLANGPTLSSGVEEPKPVLVPPPGALPEGEDCGTDMNGGCNSEPPFSTEAECGDSFAGTAWAELGMRDTDWYRLTLTAPAVVTLTGAAEFPLRLFILEGFCPANPLSTVFGAPFETASTTAMLGPGTYYLWAGNEGFDGNPCGSGANDYWIKIDCSAAKEPKPVPSGSEGVMPSWSDRVDGKR